MLLMVIFLATMPPQLPPGITCSQVRALVAEHGLFKAIIWARSHGYSWPEIVEAKKCLKTNWQ